MKKLRSIAKLPRAVPMAATAAILLITSNARAEQLTKGFFAGIESVSNNGSAGTEAGVVLTIEALSELHEGYVNHEFWYQTDPFTSSFIEIGVKDGVDTFGVRHGQEIFWAESSPVTMYRQHFTGLSANLDQSHTAFVIEVDQCDWQVFFDQQLGTSTFNCFDPDPTLAPIRILGAGLQSDDPSRAFAEGFLHNWWEVSNSGVGTLGWDNLLVTANDPPFTLVTQFDAHNVEELMNGF